MRTSSATDFASILRITCPRLRGVRGGRRARAAGQRGGKTDCGHNPTHARTAIQGTPMTRSVTMKITPKMAPSCQYLPDSM
jgi:hypothetical protein